VVAGAERSGADSAQTRTAAEPTKDWDQKWGSGFMKGPDFVRMLYAAKAGQGV